MQHLKISSPTAVALIERMFGGLDPEAALFEQSPAAYRYRWDKILALECIPKQLHVTPGGLRGGGAVDSYRKQIPLVQIQFRMRLKHLHTIGTTFRRRRQYPPSLNWMALLACASESPLCSSNTSRPPVVSSGPRSASAHACGALPRASDVLANSVCRPWLKVEARLWRELPGAPFWLRSFEHGATELLLRRGPRSLYLSAVRRAGKSSAKSFEGGWHITCPTRKQPRSVSPTRNSRVGGKCSSMLVIAQSFEGPAEETEMKEDCEAEGGRKDGQPEDGGFT